MVRTGNPPRQKRDLEATEAPPARTVATMEPRSLWFVFSRAQDEHYLSRVNRSGARKHLLFGFVHTVVSHTGLG